MSARMKGRRRQVAALLEHTAVWARARDDLRAVALVGSYARGTARLGSDVDLVLMTDCPDGLLPPSAWRGLVGPARPVRHRRWGPVTEQRLRLPSGLHIELGITTPAWAALPLDPGSQRVLAGGVQILYDPHGLLDAAVGAVET